MKKLLILFLFTGAVFADEPVTSTYPGVACADEPITSTVTVLPTVEYIEDISAYLDQFTIDNMWPELIPSIVFLDDDNSTVGTFDYSDPDNLKFEGDFEAAKQVFMDNSTQIGAILFYEYIKQQEGR